MQIECCWNQRNITSFKRWKTIRNVSCGEVSTYKDGKLVVDKPWEEGAIKVIRKSKFQFPIYFHAKNSKLFYFLSKIDDTLRTAKLPSELLNTKDRVIKVRIGKPISVANKTNIKILKVWRFLTQENLHAFECF